MFGQYLATKEDLLAIDEALRFVWHPKMDFVFKDRSKISKTVVISYDSQFIFLWKSVTEENPRKYKLYKFPHSLKVKDEWQYVWKADLWVEEVEALLASSIRNASQFALPRISGGLLTPFIELQQKRNISSEWPYTTRGSYLATILHEFAHIYWNQHKRWWFSDKKYNLNLLKTAENLYRNHYTQKPKTLLNIPISSAFGEVFAFCSEYYASSLFWRSHKNALDEFACKLIPTLVKREKIKKLDEEDSTIEPLKNTYDFALVVGKIILTLYPTKWPDILTSVPVLK